MPRDTRLALASVGYSVNNPQRRSRMTQRGFLEASHLSQLSTFLAAAAGRSLWVPPHVAIVDVRTFGVSNDTLKRSVVRVFQYPVLQIIQALVIMIDCWEIEIHHGIENQIEPWSSESFVKTGQTEAWLRIFLFWWTSHSACLIETGDLRFGGSVRCTTQSSRSCCLNAKIKQLRMRNLDERCKRLASNEPRITLKAIQISRRTSFWLLSATMSFRSCAGVRSLFGYPA